MRGARLAFLRTSVERFAVEVPPVGNALELVFAAVVKADAGARNKVLDGPRGQDFARAGERLLASTEARARNDGDLLAHPRRVRHRVPRWDLARPRPPRRGPHADGARVPSLVFITTAWESNDEVPRAMRVVSWNGRTRIPGTSRQRHPTAACRLRCGHRAATRGGRHYCQACHLRAMYRTATSWGSAIISAFPPSARPLELGATEELRSLAANRRTAWVAVNDT